MRISRNDLIDGDVFYFKGDPQYLYEVYGTDSGLWTVSMGTEVPLPLSQVRNNHDQVELIHNSMDKRPEFRDA